MVLNDSQNRADIPAAEIAMKLGLIHTSPVRVIDPQFREAFTLMNERACNGSKEHLDFKFIGLQRTFR